MRIDFDPEAFPMAVPAVISERAWCHAECFRKWNSLTPEMQMVLGGHIHYDWTEQTWMCWRTPDGQLTPLTDLGVGL